MCGITGIINFGKVPVDKQILKDITEKLSHRGPDDEGIFCERNIGLGHRRLSILDLSKAGHQPMFYDNRNLIIVFNGEIYNYLEIRDQLVKLGFKFRSQSDTEVILAAYKEWGENCLSKFNGMWSFVIYDRKKKLIFAARDRMGVKPFYYFYDKQKFIFASEIKAIIAHPAVKIKPNDQIIWDFVICGGLTDHSSETFFNKIKELRGGHLLKLDLKTKKLEIKKYWDLDPQVKIDFLSQEKYNEVFRKLFYDAVKIRLRSDVPVGTCLSGGLDSSAITCVINDLLKKEGKIKQIGEWQKTFSAIYSNKEHQQFDESKFIKEVVSKTKVKPYYTRPDGNKIVQEIKKIIWHQDYPIASTSIYAQWNVFRLAASKNMKVMLDGQGADELLAGYYQFFGIYFGQLLLEGKLGRLFRELRNYSKRHQKSIFSIFKELFIDVIRKGIFGDFLTNLIKRQFREFSLFKPEWRYRYSPPRMVTPTRNNFQNSIHSGFKIGLCSLLRYEDRDSMAFSIESRTPFLDYRLVEYLYSLPDSQKINQGQSKWLMRNALKGILPEKIRTRQDKIGFATPEEIWMKDKLGQDMKKVFASRSFNGRGYFIPGKTSQMFEEYLAGKLTNFQLFWRLYCLEIWFRVFIDKNEM